MRIYCIISIVWCSAVQMAHASQETTEPQPLPQPQPQWQSARARKAIRCYCRQNEFRPNITVCNKMSVAANAWFTRIIEYETDEKTFFSLAESTVEMIKPGESLIMHAYTPSIVPFRGICLCRTTNITNIIACTFYLCSQSLDWHSISYKKIDKQSRRTINLVNKKKETAHQIPLHEDTIKSPQS